SIRSEQAGPSAPSLWSSPCRGTWRALPMNSSWHPMYGSRRGIAYSIREKSPPRRFPRLSASSAKPWGECAALRTDRRRLERRGGLPQHGAGAGANRARSAPDRAIDFAKQIAAAAPLGVRALLASAHRAVSESEKLALATLQPAFVQLLRSKDRQQY